MKSSDKSINNIAFIGKALDNILSTIFTMDLGPAMMLTTMVHIQIKAIVIEI